MLVARELTKEYQSGTQTLAVLKDVSFSIPQGEFVAIVGPSGSGKTTLLGLLAGLDVPSRGTVEIDGVGLHQLSEDARALLRGQKVGFVFQSFQLIPTLTALENVQVPLELRGDEGTGWSKAWKINFWARLQDGDHAYRMIQSLVHPTRERGFSEGGGLYPNLFDAHPPFQIDGNFGLTSGIVQMLLQDEDGATVDIHLLPALPSVWPAGRVTGLRTRGGFTIDLRWSGGALTQAVLHATRAGVARVRYRGQVREYRMRAGEAVVLRP